jgi:hypothetical protein
MRHWRWDIGIGWGPCNCRKCPETHQIPTPLHPSAIGREYDLFRIELNRRWVEKYG